MDLSLFCEMSFIFLDSVFTVTFGGERKLKLLEDAGAFEEGESSVPFQES